MPAKKKVETPALRPALLKDEKGIVDWKSLVNKDFIYLNEFAYGKEGIDVSQLSEEEKEKLKETSPDTHVLMTLAAFRELVTKRGYKSIDYDIQHRHTDLAVCKCTIQFSPNEDEPDGVIFSAISSASLENTFGGFSQYLDGFAETRSFLRCARNYFRIDTLAREEIDPNKKVEVVQLPTPVLTFKNLMAEKNMSFDQLKEAVIASNKIIWDENWKDISKLNPATCFSLTLMVKEWAAPK